MSLLAPLEKIKPELREPAVYGMISEKLSRYIQFCAPAYQMGRAHRFLCKRLDKVLLSLDMAPDVPVPRRLIINMPPRHGKSRLTAVEMCTYMMGKRPGTKIISTSYSAKLALHHSRESQARIYIPRFKKLFPGLQMPYGLKGVPHWGLTNGSEYKAVGREGQVTGSGADILLIDDMFADYLEAYSETIRETVWNFYLSTAYTRLSPSGVIIIVMTRWHVDDLTGRLLNTDYTEKLSEFGASEQYELINLPGIAQDGDPLGRKPGEALHPERWPEQVVRARMAAQNDFIASAMYDGKPVPAGGNYVSRDQFQVVTTDKLPEGGAHFRWKRFWDVATDEGKMNDFTASPQVALAPDLKNPKEEALYIRRMIHGKWKWPMARDKILNTGIAEKCLVGVEAVAGFKTSVANLREEQDKLPSSQKDWVIHEIGVEKDKLMRALPWFALVEKRRCYIVVEPPSPGDSEHPERRMWVQTFFKEVEAFPKGKHDDQVDAVSGGYAMCKAGRKIILI